MTLVMDLGNMVKWLCIWRRKGLKINSIEIKDLSLTSHLLLPICSNGEYIKGVGQIAYLGRAASADPVPNIMSTNSLLMINTLSSVCAKSAVATISTLTSSSGYSALMLSLCYYMLYINEKFLGTWPRYQ